MYGKLNEIDFWILVKKDYDKYIHDKNNPKCFYDNSEMKYYFEFIE